MTSPSLRWREWDGDCIVFNPVTGHTHLLDALAARILRHVCAGAPTAGAIVERLGREIELNLDSTAVASIDQALDRLARLGLVEPA